jgi:lysophospholipase L1-like esterase
MGLTQIRKFLAASSLAAAVFATACVQRPGAVATPASQSAEPFRFAAEIARFDSLDRVHMPAPGGVLFVGSSTIRLWPDLKSDFPGVDVIQRGVGGSRMDEILMLTPKIVLPYKPRLIVLYAGDNDLAEGRTAAQVFEDYKSFTSLVHRSLPSTRIVFVSIKPSESRWQLVDQMRAANETVKRLTDTDRRLLYVDVFTPMLGADGRPRPELYRDDKLHMTPAGYTLWRQLLASVVED